MNLSAVLVVLLAMQLLKNQSEKPKLTQLLNDDISGLIQCLEGLTKSDGDKMTAILQLLQNPMAMQFVEALLKKQPQPEPQPKEKFQNDEGYTFETPSRASVEFFRPIENIADSEVKHKLYKLYDSRYLK